MMHHGLPHSVLLDQGTQFTSAFTKSLYKALGIRMSTSTAHHPQSDGQTERANQELEQYCKGTYPSDPSDPPSPIPSASATSVYTSSSYYSFTFISLFILMFTLRSDPPSDPIVFMHSSSVSYSFIVRYLFILFPEPSTACPRVGTVYIQLLNTCYRFPQINSLWTPLTGQFPLLL